MDTPPTPEDLVAEADRLWLARQADLTEGTPSGFITLAEVGGASRREMWATITVVAAALGGVGAYCWIALS